MRVVRFHTAGVRVDLVHPGGPALDLVVRVGAAMLTATDTGPPDVVVHGLDVTGLPDGDDGRVASRLLAAVERGALGATPALAVHAAAIAGPGGCIVLPGRSGVGKSTLAAAAMQEGLSLVSDEAACFIDPFGSLLPHPRPVALSLASRRLLGVATPDDVDEEVGLPGDQFGQTAHPDTVQQCVGIVLPRRERGAATTVTSSVARSTVLAHLLAGLLGTSGPSPEHSWQYLTRLVADVWVARLEYDHPRKGASGLARILG